MRESREDSADKVENKIPQVTETVFDVVAKDKKEKHIAENVRDAPMHEHRGEQREVNRNQCRLQSWHLHALAGELLDRDRPRDDISAGDDLSGHGRVSVGEPI